MPTETKLIDQISRQISEPASPAIHALADRLIADHGDAIEAILFYGSCLRTGEDRGGLVDLYVLLDVFGEYWSYPSWANVSTGIDFETMTVPSGSDTIEIIPSFNMPPVPDVGPLYFYGAMFESGYLDLDHLVFGVELTYELQLGGQDVILLGDPAGLQITHVAFFSFPIIQWCATVAGLDQRECPGTFFDADDGGTDRIGRKDAQFTEPAGFGRDAFHRTRHGRQGEGVTLEDIHEWHDVLSP